MPNGSHQPPPRAFRCDPATVHRLCTQASMPDEAEQLMGRSEPEVIEHLFRKMVDERKALLAQRN